MKYAYDEAHISHLLFHHKTKHPLWRNIYERMFKNTYCKSCYKRINNILTPSVHGCAPGGLPWLPPSAAYGGGDMPSSGQSSIYLDHLHLHEIPWQCQSSHSIFSLLSTLELSILTNLSMWISCLVLDLSIAHFWKGERLHWGAKSPTFDSFNNLGIEDCIFRTQGLLSNTFSFVCTLQALTVAVNAVTMPSLNGCYSTLYQTTKVKRILSAWASEVFQSGFSSTSDLHSLSCVVLCWCAGATPRAKHGREWTLI